MKKSKLRNIIRESIKELYEQGIGCYSAQPTSLSTSNISNDSAQLSWGMPVGSINSFEISVRLQGSYWGSGQPGTGTFSSQSNNALLSGLMSGTTYEWKVRSICNEGPSDWSSIEAFDTQAPVVNPQGGGCNPSEWGGYSSWTNSFNNMPHFSSTNPNQPCNMVCKKKSTWNSKLSSTPHGPQANQLACKVEAANLAIQTHSCGC